MFTDFRFCSHPLETEAVPVEVGSPVTKMRFYRKGHTLMPGETCTEPLRVERRA